MANDQAEIDDISATFTEEGFVGKVIKLTDAYDVVTRQNVPTRNPIDHPMLRVGVQSNSMGANAHMKRHPELAAMTQDIVLVSAKEGTVEERDLLYFGMRDWRIVWIDELAPANVVLMYYVGIARV